MRYRTHPSYRTILFIGRSPPGRVIGPPTHQTYRTNTPDPILKKLSDACVIGLCSCMTCKASYRTQKIPVLPPCYRVERILYSIRTNERNTTKGTNDELSDATRQYDALAVLRPYARGVCCGWNCCARCDKRGPPQLETLQRSV